MEMKLGDRIANLRKAKGMTQEQLANSVGVSPPAVSKWETDSSYPDIALLCPLARALDTNVDTLLHFEETLTSEQIAAYMKEIMDYATNGDLKSAEDLLQKLLHTYPSSIELKYNAHNALCAFNMFFPKESEEKLTQWEREKEVLLNYVHLAGNSPYWQYAVSGLASLAIAKDDIAKAEPLLKELPDHNIDTTMLWSQIYLKRGEPEKALESTQKKLYTLVRQTQLCLVSMMNKEILPDNEKMMEICKIYRQIEDIFGIGGGLSEGFFVEAYERLGDSDKQKESLLKMMKDANKPLLMPNPVLFSPAIKIKDEQPRISMLLRKMLLRGLSEDKSMDEFQENPEVQRAIQELKQSIEEDKI
ncbi:DNA-binding transcriptional regulator, XRE-family HTH domain [Hathewaya proteolytica DSM 3090]|uniref:DNA-binding transcriptional regulator, XRE-family HTH domain n=1 Tax=Hathewaya proteolytica DSM 3090 TaxID=1121331 RepID=A0A1M6KIG4_9CLOT|nr:helix-turn-helix transcriptional regulator [Hathewaya proteolytica]SHJ58747.1 DNA-binding transcriptional regulator, XRE-family HTH domain [Hathewaya proteolytica DSM 3090]